MQSFFEHELKSYQQEIDRLSKDLEAAKSEWHQPDFNLTHFSFGTSNRGNFLAVGLCSLVEIQLHELTLDREQHLSNKIESHSRMGLLKVVNYLKDIKAIPFGTLRQWDDFNALYTVRNLIVHGYGGLIPPSDEEKLSKALKKLKMTEAFATKRIRLNPNHLQISHQIVKEVVSSVTIVTT